MKNVFKIGLFQPLGFEVKVTETLKYILPFSREKHGQQQGTCYQILRKYVIKIVLSCAIEKVVYMSHVKDA